MDHSVLIVTVSVLATLAATGALGGTALMVGAYMDQRAKRLAAEALTRALADTNAKLAAENKHLRFVRGNKLYSRAEQDLGFAAQQSIIRLRVARADLEEQLSIIEKLLDTERDK